MRVHRVTPKRQAARPEVDSTAHRRQTVSAGLCCSIQISCQRGQVIRTRLGRQYGGEPC